MELIFASIVLGCVATLISDFWSFSLKKIFSLPSLDFSMVGRWICHFPSGRFVHDDIKKAKKVRIESVVGWSAHYLIGITFAFLLLVVVGSSWLNSPTLLPALLFGILTVAAPFLLMQPGMGSGIAASKTPNPTIARLRSLMVHAIFGLGLYLGGLVYGFFIY